jgi:3-oxoacyl-[acyl-carrier-protein] synthase II
MAKRLKRCRVVITGVGAVSCMGLDLQSTWNGLVEGRSGIDYISGFAVEGYPANIAGEVRCFDPSAWMPAREARVFDRYIHLGLAAAEMAVRQSGIAETLADPTEVGCLIGSGVGGLDTAGKQLLILGSKGSRYVSPFSVPSAIANTASSLAAAKYGFKGPNWAIVAACASGAAAIADAMLMIQCGMAEAIVAGAAEALTAYTIGGFGAAKALSVHFTDPKTASRPFDAERNGFVASEGACVLVLESLEYATARGANILAELAGMGVTCDAYHPTLPDPSGETAARGMRLALEDAELNPEEIDYVNAHATSTPIGDRIECLAISQVFGGRRVPISSTKSAMGHMLGAAGSIEAGVCMLAIREGVLPPTINYENPDPSCDIDCVPNEARPAKVRAALTNSFGFGGHNVCLILKSV